MSVVLSVMAIGLHCTGLVLLKKSKDRHTFIANFSLWNIFWALSNLVRYPLIRYGSGRIFNYWTLVIEGARIPFYMAILYITIDRFLQLYLHLRYEDNVLKKHKRTFCICSMYIYILWVICVVPICAFEKATFETLHKITYIYLTGIFHAILCALILPVYSYISWKLLSKSYTRRQKRKTYAKLIIPCYIVVSYSLQENVRHHYVTDNSMLHCGVVHSLGDCSWLFCDVW